MSEKYLFVYFRYVLYHLVRLLSWLFTLQAGSSAYYEVHLVIKSHSTDVIIYCQIAFRRISTLLKRQIYILADNPTAGQPNHSMGPRSVLSNDRMI